MDIQFYRWAISLMREIQDPFTTDLRIDQIEDKLWYIDYKWGAAKQLKEAINERRLKMQTPSC